jgi:type I restriction enzyme S subunit
MSNTAQLKELCSFRHGGTPSKSNPAFWGGDIPWVSPKDMKTTMLMGAQDSITLRGIEESATSLVPAGSILTVVRSGILAHSLPLALAARPLTFNQDIKAIQVTDRRVCHEYVYWFLRSKELDILARGVKKGATVHSLQSGYIENLVIPILPDREQRRIIDLLSRAENIVRMRREAERKASQLSSALFLAMFGDPTTNPKGWPVRRLGDVVERFEGGKNVQAGAAKDSKYRILKISAVTSGVYDESESKPAPRGFEPPSHYFVRVGDVLFSRANTEALVGATALVSFTDGNCLLPDKLWRLVWRSIENTLPSYMLALLQNESVRQLLSKIASGTGGSMKNISQGKLAELKLAIAPVECQRVFEESVSMIRTLLSDANRAGEIADLAFQSLLATSFEGQPRVGAVNA